ncbi:hypothetical protein N7373_04105 [Achromobacter mucicolens]|uniref:toxin VasX n=1 Tax=Achromobacter mucicolens TaxID=1389922 RepID=UPI00244C1561|nr:toxin VasX [Achromobacter mucicolens]MDH0090618.1 hypothetical protein [Achromobacter mucicolens]
MSTPHKNARGPDRPNEKKLGKAISPPPCERCVHIYPLRYGVADRTWDKGVFPTLSTAGYPKLAAGKAYGLRVLRPGTYVYLCYFQNGRMWTQHYQVTDDMRFARIWWTRADEHDAISGRLALPETATAKPYLSAPSSETADAVAAADRQAYEIDNNHALHKRHRHKQNFQSVQKRATPDAYAKRRDLVRFDANDNADLFLGNQPSLALFPQQEPLVFTRGTWLTDPIDEELLAPVAEPK